MRLDSTLNIEFVYVILEGIVKIARMRLDDSGNFSVQGNDMDVDPEDISVSEDRQDLTLKVRQIEIDNLNAWEPMEG